MSRRGPLAFLLVPATLVCAARVATAGWGADGVTIRATGSTIPVVAACTDAETGTFVAWLESGPGAIRVHHLLSSGDLDPAWPADGAPASDPAAQGRFVDVVPDRQGGVYVCWVEGTGSSSLFVTRLDPNGQVAGGWPAPGKPLGAVNPEQGRPRMIEDGAYGLFAVWTTGPELLTQRLGTDGLGTGGWSDAPAVVAPAGPVDLFRFWPDLALDSDGGVFVSWATWSSDTTRIPSGLYVGRLTGAGGNAPGWPAGGRYLGFLRPEYVFDSGGTLSEPLLDIAPDARGGLFCIAGSLRSSRADVYLHRLLADGQPAAGWPSTGRQLPWYRDTYPYNGYGWPEQGLQVHPDGQDGAIVESQFFSTHYQYNGVSRCVDGGSWLVQLQVLGFIDDVVPKGDGGAFLASCVPTGPFAPYEPDAFIAVDQSLEPPGWTPWFEPHAGSATPWFGDIALAPANGGVVFFWSQVRERFGLFARRFTTVGQVTGVDPGPGPGSLALSHLRFVSGTGVVARVTMVTPARLALFDVAGRLISSRILDDAGPGAADVTLPGTASLASGLYFARLVGEQSATVGRVAVIR